jgi:broad specificity phosphatase PhoE
VCGAEVEVDERLIELDYGDWDGKPLAEMRGPRGELWFADPHFAPPGGESLVAVTARVEAFCVDRIADAAAGRIVAVSHVSPIKAAVTWALGVDERATLRMQLGLASITTIGARGNGSGYLSSFNDSAHLEQA